MNTIGHTQQGNVADWNATPSGKENTSTPGLSGAYFSLLLFMVIYYARPQDWIPGMMFVPLGKISGFLALGALVLSSWNSYRRLPREVVLLILLTCQLFAAALLSQIWRGGAMQNTIDFAKVFLIVMVIGLSVRTMKRLRLLILIQALSIAIIAIVTVWKRHQLVDGRMEGLFGSNYSDPNDLALAIIISLPLCLALLFSSKGLLRKAFWTVAMLTMVYAVFLTGSRGGFIALVATGAVSLWEFGIQARKHFLLVAAALAGLVFWQVAGGLISGRLHGTFGATDNAVAAFDSAQAREQLFKQSIAITLAHPLFGVGPGNFQQVSGSWHETHNSFTQMSSEGGVAALVLYALILWTGFKNLRTIKQLTEQEPKALLWVGALRAALVGYVVGSFFLSVAYQFFPYFLVAYTTALLLITRDADTQAQEIHQKRIAPRLAPNCSAGFISSSSLGLKS